MLDAVGDDLDGQFFRVADGFFPSCAVTHDSGQFHGFGNPAAIFLAVEFNGENHRESIHQCAPWVSAARILRISLVNLMSKLEGKHLYMVRLPIKRVIL